MRSDGTQGVVGGRRRLRITALGAAMLAAAALGTGCSDPSEGSSPSGSAEPSESSAGPSSASPTGSSNETSSSPSSSASTSETPTSGEASESTSDATASTDPTSSGMPTGGGSGSPQVGDEPADPADSSPPSDPWERDYAEVEPTPEMTSEHLIDWEDYRPVVEEDEAPGQATALEFLLISGSDNCYGVRSVVEEDEETVRVGTITGLLPETPQACTAEGRMVSLIVPLDEPLGEREVIPMDDEEVELAE